MPMIPHELFAGQRIVAMAYGIAFIAGGHCRPCDLPYADIVRHELLCHAEFPSSPLLISLRSRSNRSWHQRLCNWSLQHSRGCILQCGPFLVQREEQRATALGDCPHEYISHHFTQYTSLTRMCSCIQRSNGCSDTRHIRVGSWSRRGKSILPATAHSLTAVQIAFFGVGGVLVPAATIAITVAPDTVIATTVALSLTVRAIGGSIGYAIYYNIFINKLTPKLPVKISEYAIAAGLNPKNAELFVTTYLTAPAEIAKVPGVTAEIITAAGIGSRWAYSESLKYVWLASIPFGVIAITACLFIGSISKYMTSRVAAKIKQ